MFLMRELYLHSTNIEMYSYRPNWPWNGKDCLAFSGLRENNQMETLFIYEDLPMNQDNKNSLVLTIC
jgi:hypothetical protein